MNKRMKYYGAAWLIAFGIFNVIAFVAPGVDPTLSKFNAAFWIGYVSIAVAFIGQLICALIALKEENNQKLFYNISLISVSYTGLIVMLLIGALCMAIPGLPYWVGIIACVLVLGFTAISVIKASAAIDEVNRIDKKIKEQTFFIKALTVDADQLVVSAKTPELKEQAKKIYDAIRYSDPMSNPALSGIEDQISEKFAAFSAAVNKGDADSAKTTADELLLLIHNRNQKCKLLK
ncbi:MAG: hypothetical protein IJ766_06450 [Clostridia bacterium]|nr:hypothetical protein [Clostridia bacterium]